MQLAAIRAAQQSGDSSRALQVLKELSDQVADGSEEERMMVQLMMGDVQHSVRCVAQIVLCPATAAGLTVLSVKVVLVVVKRHDYSSAQRHTMLYQPNPYAKLRTATRSSDELKP